MSDPEALIVTNFFERVRRSRVAMVGFDRRLCSELLLLLDALLEYVHQEAGRHPRPARGPRRGEQVLTAEAVRQQRELDGLDHVRRGGRAVCVWLACPQCRRSFAAVAVPAGAKFCRRCAAPKRRIR